MGCAQSRIENEEAVSRCKDRKQYLRDAVAARSLLAASHSAHAVALKNAGAALGDYAHGEAEDNRSPQPSAHEPHIDPLPPPPPSADEPHIDSFPLPPPPLPDFSPSPLARSFSMPDLPLPRPTPDLTPAATIQEEDGGDDVLRNAEDAVEPEPTTPATPLPPPPPPSPPAKNRVVPPPEPRGVDAWDFFFSGIPEEFQGDTLPQMEELETHVEEESKEVDGEGESKSREQENVDGSRDRSEENVEKTPEKVVVEPPAKASKNKHRSGGSISEVIGSEGSGEGKMAAAAKKSLLQILTELDDHFLKASESTHEVSRMLEANRLHYHSNFVENQGYIDHSARVMRVITWSKPSKNTPNADGNNDIDKDEWETHATVLDKLLAWEKKLYDEVKASEIMKLEYQRKVALLKKQKKRGSHPEALEKTKAAVCHLHTRYVVDMQSLDSTVSEIHRLRDHLLYPKLVDLVKGMDKMWETMHMNHDRQLMIVVDLRALDVSNVPKETSNQHHNRTRQLCRILGEWHSQFEKLMTHQKEYIQALNSWLKLALIPIETSLKEKASSPPSVQHPPILFLLRSWHEQFEKLPVELAKGAISSFSAVMDAILVHQEEELKQKDKYEEIKKEYTRKHRAFDEWYQKYMQRKLHGSSLDAADPDRTETGTNTNDPVSEKQFAVDTLKKRLDDEMEAYHKECKHVREKSLGSLKTHLPELFRAMSDFSLACTDMYKKLQGISEPHANGSPN
ncbi:hypothetical protein AAC387_Pa05g1610 [Persea americana]